MFGYVKIFKDELKVKEYDLFKAYYCGLCKTIKKNYGFAARMGLSYDLTFLSLLLASVYDTEDKINPESCIANPLKKKPVRCGDSYAEYCASANVILTYFKLLDDLYDNHSVKSAFALLFMISSKRKAKKKEPLLFENVKKYMKALSALEKKHSNEPDALADKFAHLTETIFTPSVIKDEKINRVLGVMGYQLGRFIYLLDACDDYERDKKSGAYNVLTQDGCPVTKDELLASLEFTLSEVANAYNLLEIKKNKTITDNIIYLGLMDSLNKVRNPQAEKKERKNERSL